jgi:hypothetical protein
MENKNFLPKNTDLHNTGDKVVLSTKAPFTASHPRRKQSGGRSIRPRTVAAPDFIFQLGQLSSNEARRETDVHQHAPDATKTLRRRRRQAHFSGVVFVRIRFLKRHQIKLDAIRDMTELDDALCYATGLGEFGPSVSVLIESPPFLCSRAPLSEN